ncbi:unnamed protein product, partial [Mesorhabditis spiculigera]
MQRVAFLFFILQLVLTIRAIQWSDRLQALAPTWDERCPNVNEVWTECGLEPTCKRCDFHAEPCNTACHRGCTCREGFMYDALWRCVPQDKCRDDRILYI